MNCLWDTVEQLVAEERNGEAPCETGLPQV